MDKIFAYTDESGAFGWNFDLPNVSTHFVIASIIVKEENLPSLQKSLDGIRKKYFGNAEMKSKSIGNNYQRRRSILGDLVSLPFTVFAVVFDKRKMTNYNGLRYKQPFYKFLNNIVHKELRRAFTNVVVMADEIGGSEYMQSFSSYFRSKSDIPTLFGDASFYFNKSDNNVCVQLADIIAGTIARKYDELYKKDTVTDFIPIIKSKITRIQLYPQTYENYQIENSAIAQGYDRDIANICLKQAVEFVERNKDSKSPDIQAQIVVLDYLLFRFLNNDLRKYIPTKELQSQLSATAYGNVSTQTFRNKIIAKLRDEGVIIASSSNGYKIPSKESELFDFVNHGTTIIYPMIARLRKCRDLIKLGTTNGLDLFEHIENEDLRNLLEQ